mmetsp:Transcript_2184/g.3807  ORF Transcript_2184/g.3807 Transcript_2184/m.3807 type:complete len:165 (+) Transcript_2184:456-950(+)
MAISGKSRELCIEALRAAQNIPDLAFQFLTSGDITDMGMGMGQGGDEAEEYGAEEEGSMQGVTGMEQDPETMAAIQSLINNPSFPMIRQRMLQDPNFSQQFLQQLQQTQPQIYQALQQNPSLLMTLLLGHDPASGLARGPPMGGMPGAGGAGVAGGQPMAPGSI